MVSDRQIFVDTKQVVGMPANREELSHDRRQTEIREQYQPREDGIFTITAHDDQNKPVAAEVSFGLVDESVYYIQSDYAGDPRQFYFGQKRPHAVQIQSTFNQKSFAKLVEGEEHRLMDIRERAELDRAKAEGRVDGKNDRNGQRQFLKMSPAASAEGGRFGRNRMVTKSLSGAAGEQC